MAFDAQRGLAVLVGGVSGATALIDPANFYGSETRTLDDLRGTGEIVSSPARARRVSRWMRSRMVRCMVKGDCSSLPSRSVRMGLMFKSAAIPAASPALNRPSPFVSYSPIAC